MNTSSEEVVLDFLCESPFSGRPRRFVRARVFYLKTCLVAFFEGLLPALLSFMQKDTS